MRQINIVPLMVVVVAAVAAPVSTTEAGMPLPHENSRQLSIATPECPRCDTFHNFENGIVGSSVAPESLKPGDPVCLKGLRTAVDSFDGLGAPFHFACYMMEENGKCPSDASACTFEGLPEDTCECTHYKNGAYPESPAGSMCVTAYGYERPLGPGTARGYLEIERGARICTLPDPKLPYEERFGESVGRCEHPALPCHHLPHTSTTTTAPPAVLMNLEKCTCPPEYMNACRLWVAGPRDSQGRCAPCTRSGPWPEGTGCDLNMAPTPGVIGPALTATGTGECDANGGCACPSGLAPCSQGVGCIQYVRDGATCLCKPTRVPAGTACFFSTGRVGRSAGTCNQQGTCEAELD